MAQKMLVIANWKMNPDSPSRAVNLAQKIDRGTRGAHSVEVVIAPPFPFLLPVGEVLKNSKLGAQNLFWSDVGPYTGQVSWHQLKHLKVTYVILGHSEERALGETDKGINKKIKAAVKVGLAPVLAIGEKKKMPEKKMRTVLERQLRSDLAGVRAGEFKKGVIAYEPIWAIGTGLSATPEHARKALGIIQEILVRIWKTPKESLRDPTGRAKNISTRVLYGGSVKAKNAAPFVSKNGGGMHGMLVGGASLNAKEFIGIVRAASKSK